MCKEQDKVYISRELTHHWRVRCSPVGSAKNLKLIERLFFCHFNFEVYYNKPENDLLNLSYQ